MGEWPLSQERNLENTTKQLLLGRKQKQKKVFNEKIALLAKLGNDWSDGESDKRMEVDTEYKRSDRSVPPIQDFDTEPVMIGGDVVALYPSMDGIATAELAAQ